MKTNINLERIAEKLTLQKQRQEAVIVKVQEIKEDWEVKTDAIKAITLLKQQAQDK